MVPVSASVSVNAVTSLECSAVKIFSLFLPCDGWFRFANASTFERDFGTIIRLPDDGSLRKCRFDKVLRYGRFVAYFSNSNIIISKNFITYTKICSVHNFNVITILIINFKMFSYLVLCIIKIRSQIQIRIINKS